MAAVSSPTPRTLAALMGEPITSGLRIGLLGGSFNPAHEGHAHISQEALVRLGLDQVWWLVSPQNPLKSAAEMADMGARTSAASKMAQHPRFRVCNLETHLGTTFTADTLRALTKMAPDVRFVWLMGADNLIQLPKWRNWEDIMHSVPVAVFARPGYTSAAALSPAARKFERARLPEAAGRILPYCDAPAWILFHSSLHPQSASAIRANGKWPLKS